MEASINHPHSKPLEHYTAEGAVAREIDALRAQVNALTKHADAQSALNTEVAQKNGETISRLAAQRDELAAALRIVRDDALENPTLAACARALRELVNALGESGTADRFDTYESEAFENAKAALNARAALAKVGAA